MWNGNSRSILASPPETPEDEHPFRSSGIGRGSSSGATPEQMFVSWHTAHGTVPTPTILVTTKPQDKPVATTEACGAADKPKS